jgi:hypothetical protein
MLRRSSLVLPVVVAACLLGTPSTGASATGVQCGAVITTDVVLSKNLVCSGDGLTIPGDANVTLNLNGYSITGSGSGSGLVIGDSPWYAVKVGGSVTVLDGTIRRFAAGITFGFDRSTVQLERLVIRENGSGIVRQNLGGPQFTLSDSQVADNSGVGVDTGFGLGRSGLINDQIRNNGGDGIHAGEDTLALLQDNFVAHNGGYGAFLKNAGPAVISGNTFLGNGQTGLEVGESSPCVFLPHYDITGNVAKDNGAGGIIVGDGPWFTSCPLLLPPSWTGNAASHDGGVDCLGVVCGKNRGQVTKPADPAGGNSLRHSTP